MNQERSRTPLFNCPDFNCQLPTFLKTYLTKSIFDVFTVKLILNQADIVKLTVVKRLQQVQSKQRYFYENQRNFSRFEHNSTYLKLNCSDLGELVLFRERNCFFLGNLPKQARPVCFSFSPVVVRSPTLTFNTN